MGKMYTLDHKLLTETPELRIGDKLYPVDNRMKTVEKIQEVAKSMQESPYEGISSALKLALGNKAAKDIQEMNMPYPAYQQLFELVMAAVTGEDPAAPRFQETK